MAAPFSGPRRRFVDRCPTTLICGVVLLGALAAGCGGDSSGSSPLTDRLESLPGVEHASVHDDEVDDELFFTRVTVIADPDISADELDAVVKELKDSPDQAVVYLGGDEDAGYEEFASLDIDDPNAFYVDPEEPPREQDAESFVAVVTAVPDAHVTSSHGYVAVTVESDVPSAATEAANAVLESSRAVPRSISFAVMISDLSARDGADRARRLAWFSASDLDAAAVRAWQAFLAAEASAPVSVLSRSLSLGWGGEDGSVRIERTISLAGSPTPRMLTPERYEDVVWPVAHRDLDVLAQSGKGSMLTLCAARDAQVSSPSDCFLSVTADGRGSADRPGRGWDQAAAAYLRSRG